MERKPKPKQFNAFEVENDEKQKQLLKEISAKQKLVFDPNSNEEKLSLEIIFELQEIQIQTN